MSGAILKAGTVAVITLSLALLSSCANKSTKESNQAALYFGAGTQSLMNKNYTEALTNLLKANELDPNNADILINLGMAYYFKGEKDIAIRHLQRSLEINENNSDAKVNLASIYLQDGHIAKAEQLYKEVLKDLTYDKQARTYYNLGIIELENKKNMVTAEKYFKNSLKEDENYCPSYFQIGIVNFNRGLYKTAWRNFKDSTLGSCYNSPAPHYYMGLTYIKLGKFTEARLKFDEVDTKFKKSVYAVKARTKQIELNELEIKQGPQSVHAEIKGLETSDF